MAKPRAQRLLKEQEEKRGQSSKADDGLKINATIDEPCSYLAEQNNVNITQKAGGSMDLVPRVFRTASPEIDRQEAITETVEEQFEVVVPKRKARKVTQATKSKPTPNIEVANDRPKINNPFTLLKNQGSKKTRSPKGKANRKFPEVREHEQSIAIHGWTEAGEDAHAGGGQGLSTDVQDPNGFLRIIKTIFLAILDSCLLKWLINDSRPPQVKVIHFLLPLYLLPLALSSSFRLYRGPADQAKGNQPSEPVSTDDLEAEEIFMDSLEVQPQGEDAGTHGSTTEVANVEPILYIPQPTNNIEDSKLNGLPEDLLEVFTQKESQEIAPTETQTVSAEFTAQVDASSAIELRTDPVSEMRIQRAPPLRSLSAESADTLVGSETEKEMESVESSRLIPGVPIFLLPTEKTIENCGQAQIEQGTKLPSQVSVEIKKVKGAVVAEPQQLTLTKIFCVTEIEPEEITEASVHNDETKQTCEASTQTCEASTQTCEASTQTCETSTQSEKINKATQTPIPANKPRITTDQSVQTEQVDRTVRSHVQTEDTETTKSSVQTVEDSQTTPNFPGQTNPQAAGGVEQVNKNQKRRRNIKTQQSKDNRGRKSTTVHGHSREPLTKHLAVASTKDANQTTQAHVESNNPITEAVQTSPENADQADPLTLEEEHAPQTPAPAVDYMLERAQEYSQNTYQAPTPTNDVEQETNSFVHVNYDVSEADEEDLENRHTAVEASKGEATDDDATKDKAAKDEAKATQIRSQDDGQMLETTTRDSTNVVQALLDMDETSEVGETTAAAGSASSDTHAPSSPGPIPQSTQAAKETSQDIKAQQKNTLWAPMSWAKVARECEYSEKLENWADEVEAEEALRSRSS